jgi:hypothetical protein
MNWNRRFRLRSYLRSSLWIAPVAAGLAERVFRFVVEALEAAHGLGVVRSRS